MDKLKQLPQVTDHVLDGLRADDALRQKILLSAAESGRSRTSRLRTVIALCTLSAALVLLCIFAVRIPAGTNTQTAIHVIPAGSNRMVSPVNVQQVINQVSEYDPITETDGPN